MRCFSCDIKRYPPYLFTHLPFIKQSKRDVKDFIKVSCYAYDEISIKVFLIEFLLLKTIKLKDLEKFWQRISSSIIYLEELAKNNFLKNKFDKKVLRYQAIKIYVNTSLEFRSKHFN